MTTANLTVIGNVLFKRGNTAVASAYTGVPGEIIIDTTVKTIRVQDGSTAGGTRLATYTELGTQSTLANANAATQTTEINSLRANITAANGAIQSLSANIGTLVAGAPGALDTLIELGNALGNNASFSSTMVTWLGNITSNVTASNARITTLDANLGTATTNITTLFSNAATQATDINTINANIGAYQTWANGRIVTLDANLGTATTNITTLFSNAATQAGTITTLQTQVYANANVATYLSAFDGNILPSANVTYSLGSETRQWRDLWVSNNTIYIGNTPVRVAGGTLLVNGAPVSGGYSNANVAEYLPTYSGNIAANIVKNGYTWTFSNTGTTTFPTGVRLSNARGANTVNFTTDIDKSFQIETQTSTTGRLWSFGTDGNLTLPQNANINFSNGVSILSTVAGTYANANVAEYLPTYSGNVRAEYLIMSFGGIITTGASPAPIISGFRSISTAGNAPNEGNITASGNLVASRGAYITGNVTAGNLTITGNLDQPNRGFGNGPGTNLYITAGHTQGCSIPGGDTIISGGLGYNGIAWNGGNVTLRTGDYYSKQWNFDYAGNLTLPAGGDILDSTGSSILANLGNITITDSDITSSRTANFVNLGADNGYSMRLGTYGEDTVQLITDFSGNNHVWAFGANGTTTFPTNISLGYGGNNVQFPRIIAPSGKAVSLQGQGSTGSAALAWSVDHDADTKYAAVGVSQGGGDNLAKVILTAGNTTPTLKLWKFDETGATAFPNSLILAPVSQSITMQSDQYSQLMWENANLTVAPNMAINSNFYVSQNNATLDIAKRDGSGTQVTKSWYWNADGTLTLPTAGRINFDYLSISSDANVSAFYAPAGNVQLAAGIGNAQIVVNSLNDSKTWTFGNTGNLTLPQGGTITEGGGISGAIRLTPAGGANANQALLIYPTGAAEGDHVHLTAGGGSTELYLGNDFHYVKLVDGGNIELRATTANLSSQAAWTFDTTGNIDTIQALGIKVPDGVPTNVAIINSTTGSWEMNPNLSLATTGGSGSGLTVNVAETGGYASTIEIATAGTGYTNGDLITVTSGTSNATFTIVIAGRNSWQFGGTGNLTFPTGNLVITPRSVPFGNSAIISSALNNLITLSTGVNGGTSSLWVEDYANIGTSNIAAVYANPTVGSKLVRIAVGQNGGAGPKLWNFDAGGNITLPSVNFDASPSPSSSPSIVFPSEGYIGASLGTESEKFLIKSEGKTWTFDGSYEDLTFPGGTVFSNQNIAVVANANLTVTTFDGTSHFTTFGSDGNLTLPETGYLRVGTGIVAGFASSPAPIISGFSSISAENFRFQGNGVNILSTVGAGAYGNAEVAAYLLNFDGDIEFTSSTAKIGNVDVVTVGDHIRSPAYQFSNGTSIFSGITGTYSNTNTAAYLTTATITTTGNITAGNLTTSGTFTVANITTTGTYGNITGANVISANTISATNYLFANGVNILSTVAGTYSNANVTSYFQSLTSLALGSGAGATAQGVGSVALGVNAGNDQGYYAVAIGIGSGRVAQSDSAVAVGGEAGWVSQGINSVAVGYRAGTTNQANGSIILNATGANLNATTANTFTVAPVRNDVSTSNVGQVLFYNTTSKEITYGNTISIAGNLSVAGNVVQQSAYYETYANVTNSGGNLTCNFVNGATFYATLTANVTVNFTNVVATAGRVTGATLIVDQGATAYRVANIQINSGGVQTIKYAGGTPNTGTASNTDIMSFSLISLDGTNWRILGQITNYG
jgi:hypothetical protein